MKANFLPVTEKIYSSENTRINVVVISGISVYNRYTDIS